MQQSLCKASKKHNLCLRTEHREVSSLLSPRSSIIDLGVLLVCKSMNYWRLVPRSRPGVEAQSLLGWAVVRHQNANVVVTS